jgi:hypothetical protein
MKQIRIYAVHALLAVAVLSFSGCADVQPSKELGRSGVIEPAKPDEEEKAWDDMTPLEKAEYCLWWPIQWGLVFGGIMLNGHGL